MSDLLHLKWNILKNQIFLKIASFLQLNDTLANLLLYIYTLNVKLKGLYFTYTCMFCLFQLCV